MAANLVDGRDDSGRMDGRAARAERTKDAVVDAMLALIEEGDVRPTAARIAEQAGVSLRSIYQHFADLEELFTRAADRQMERMQQLAGPLPCEGALPARIHAYAEQKARLLETAAPVRRAALLAEPFSPSIAGRLAWAREQYRQELERVFAAELNACATAERAELLAALCVATGWLAWESLRRHQGLSPEQARSAMARLLMGLLRS